MLRATTDGVTVELPDALDVGIVADTAIALGVMFALCAADTVGAGIVALAATALG